MDFKSVSVNNCYILRNEVFDNQFFTYMNAKAIYSASIFHLAFFKGNIKLLPDSTIKEYEQSLIRLYRLNSPYLYIPFEINFHEDKLYQSYYESDHFPLSLWLEEKSLIPFDIFIRIIEDILFALKILEKNGISHLFLTPEEILIPLQWTASNHVKLYNVEINLIVSSLMNDEEIRNYRNNYYKNNTIKKTDKLSLNISEDLYSFGIIANKLFAFCTFNDDETKNKLQNIFNSIIKNTNNFNSLEEVISLFDDYFSETNRNNILPNNDIVNTYAGQAGFILPEYNEWHEEAELELLPENIENKSNATFRKIKKQSLFNSVSAVFKRFFFRKKKKETVSNTLKEYTELQSVITPEAEPESSVRSNFEETNNTNNIFEQTKLVLDKIDEHYTSASAEIKNEGEKDKSVITDNKNILTVKTKDTIPDLLPSTKHVETNFSETDSKFHINLNKSMEERNYKRTYQIMQKAIKETAKKERSIQELIFKNILDEKLKQLDNHYVKDTSTNILEKIAIINTIQPMKILKNNKDSEDFNSLLKKELISGNSKESTNSNNLSFFIILFNFIKNKIKNIIK